MTVSNTGKRAGADVAQVYVQVPDAKAKRLAGFTKVFLKPGEKREVSTPLERKLLADFATAKLEWVVHSGEYVVTEGRSSAELGEPVRVSLPMAYF